MNQLRIKQGSSLLATLTFTDVTGALLDLNAATLATQLRTSTGVLVGPITITPNGVAGQAVLQALASDTASWPVGLLRCDVVVTGSGLTVPTQTFMVYVEQAVTQ